jgi:hypothetical protein
MYQVGTLTFTKNKLFACVTNTWKLYMTLLIRGLDFCKPGETSVSFRMIFFAL